MKKPLALSLLAVALLLSACGAENTNNSTEAQATTSVTASASPSTTASPSPTAPVTLEPSRDAEHPKRAQGNDYSTGMLGTEEQVPGTITTAQADTSAEEEAKADTPVVPNPDHNKEATDEDKRELKQMLDNLKGAPVISAKSVVAQPRSEYKIQPATSQEANGILAKSNYSQYVILDDVAENGEEYAIIAPEIKGYEADILKNGLRPVSLETAYQAIEANFNTRIQGFKHYQPNATYTGKDVIVLHVKQKNHGEYAKAGATIVPTATSSATAAAAQ